MLVPISNTPTTVLGSCSTFSESRSPAICTPPTEREPMEGDQALGQVRATQLLEDSVLDMLSDHSKVRYSLSDESPHLFILGGACNKP